MRALALVLVFGVAAAQSPPALTEAPAPPRPSELSPPPPPPPAPEPVGAAIATPTSGPAGPAARGGALGLANGRAESKEGSSGSDLPLLGVMLDAGFPDGIGASAVARPIWFTRFYAGPTYNFIAPGLRLGGTLVPFHFFLTPTFTAEYGHAFRGNASKLVASFGKLDAAEKKVLGDVGYDYLSLQVGIETGSPRTFAWFVRAGLGWVWTRVHGFQAAAQTKNPTLTTTDPKIRLAVPTISAGVYLFVW
jgi:hypothetical protein